MNKPTFNLLLNKVSIHPDTNRNFNSPFFFFPLGITTDYQANMATLLKDFQEIKNVP